MQVGGGGGGGVGVEFLTEKKCSAKKCSWGPKTHANKNLFFGGGGGFWGVWGAPRPHPGSRGVGKRYTSSYDHDM